MDKEDLRPKIRTLIAQVAVRDGLVRNKVDKVPVSPEEDYLLDEIGRQHNLSTRASVWRFLMANYPKIEWAERASRAFRDSEVAKQGMITVLTEVPE